MTNIEKVPILKVIFADQSEIEVSQLWLETHSKMVRTMLSSSIGSNDVESITLSEVRDSKQFEQIKSTIEGDLSWLIDLEIQDKKLGSLYLAIWRTLSYLNTEPVFNWDSLNQYTIGNPNLLRILFLLDLLLNSSDQLKEKIQSKILKLFDQADRADIILWERSFHSIVSGLISIGSEIIDLRLILDRIFQQYNLALDNIRSFRNKLNLNSKFIPRLKEMTGPAWPWASSLIDKNIWPRGMILAGGAVITCCTDRDRSKIEPSEDLDFWIYGPNKEERKTRFKTALKYLTEGVEQEVIFSANHSVVSLILPGDQVRTIQLIYTDKISPEAVVNQFDFGYLKCYYDGSNLYGADEARMALELGIVDIDPKKIKPGRLYKLLRYPFMFNHFESTIDQLAEKFGLQREIEPVPNEEESSRGMDSYTSDVQSLDPSWVKLMKNQLYSYDTVQKSQQKFLHLPKGLDSKREVYLVSTILGGNFITKSLDQLCQNISYQPFTVQTYNDCFQITGDSVSSSGLLIDFSQIPLVYQTQINQILPRIKCGTIKEFMAHNGQSPYKYHMAQLDEPIVVRFRNLVVESSLMKNDTQNKTILDGYFYCADTYSGPLMTTLMSLNKELFMRAMYENGMMKNHEKLRIYKGLAKIDKMDRIRFNGITKTTYHNESNQTEIKSSTGWILGFRIPNPNVNHGEISLSMLVDIDLIFKGWSTNGNSSFGSRKIVKSLIVRKNLSPIFKPGKEVIGQPWKESYSTKRT